MAYIVMWKMFISTQTRNATKPHEFCTTMFAVVQARSVGDHNTFECLSLVGPRVAVGNGCTVGAGCHISTEETLGDDIVVYGANCDRKRAFDVNKVHGRPSVQDYSSP